MKSKEHEKKSHGKTKLKNVGNVLGKWVKFQKIWNRNGFKGRYKDASKIWDLNEGYDSGKGNSWEIMP